MSSPPPIKRVQNSGDYHTSVAHLRPEHSMRPRQGRPHTAPGSTSSHSNTPVFTPPVSLPYAPRPSTSTVYAPDASSGTPSNRTRPMQKSHSIHTTYPSSSTSPTRCLRPLPPVPSSSSLPLAVELTESPISPLSTSSISPSAPPLTIEFTESPISPISTISRSSSLSCRPLPQTPNSTSPKATRPLPQRWASLPLSVDTKNVARQSFQSDCSPTTPSPLEPPSPTTVKRKQHSKLRRHLGESIPAELVYGNNEYKYLPNVPEEIKDYTYWKVAPGPDEVERDEDSDDSDSEFSEEEVELGKTLEIRWEPNQTSEVRGSESKRQGQGGRWMREHNNRRWVASDYMDVLSALRRL